MTGTNAHHHGQAGAVTLDPAACNTLTQTAGGLLVPRTVLAGVAPGGALTTTRSVDIDVTAPTAGSCPQTWTIGARLTPRHGFKNAEAGHINLLAVVGQTVPVPASDIVLPEAGVYHVDCDVRYGLGTPAGGGSGYIVGHLRDATTNTLLTSFTQVAAVNATGQESQGGTTHLMAEYSIATGPRTIRLYLMLVRTGGTIAAAVAGGTDSNGATRLRYLKVQD